MWCGRAVRGCAHVLRKRLLACLLLLFAGSLCTVGIISSGYSRLPREYQMESQIVEMQTHLKFLESLYRAREEDIMTLQNKVASYNISHTALADTKSATLAPEVTALLKNLSDSMASRGVNAKELTLMKTTFVYQLLPHLMKDPNSLKPAFHMKADRGLARFVIGIPTVRRDKESYLMITLKHLIEGMREEDQKDSVIIIFVGETDLLFVIDIAKQIEAKYPKHVKNGMIEVLSPSASYYPNFDSVPLTLGDSAKRVKWRTKQNLDALYLMAYGQTKGTYYLMIEDDIIAKKRFMQEIKQFTASISVSVPNWFFLEFCSVGGIGKLFKSSDLVHFITYVQLFYYNMPIDWLLESYLADRVCTIDKTSNACGKNKMQVRPKYKSSLFEHIGLYSSLKGKIQKVKDPKFGALPNHFGHKNPPLERLFCDIEAHAEHSLERAYNGETFFWGITPKKGSVAEFWFDRPVNLARYTFRSGNVQHVNDKFKDTVVEILPENTRNFIKIDEFDEFGLADGLLKREIGPIEAIRLRVNKTGSHWAILSEIDLKTFDQMVEE
ncbi:alpha-1,3-mannosyl-glycoprotein 4-beta-N-acetylglucosaminyltransferase A-like isoform X2 [Zerene cesonia]|uniref:alpha-1,3-mannosyl-glycoprotein 4-beta-N-acetylglucosaminyltransferase A-like isoform X2 n=1 Tax=Zerene cesonia TaxID=33412 RepID=UPI0018E5602D|nr:alpha-1,3-mannosyl-glycoprotein 4-beta-N-acetylglucosaminyltransferase A-like isoform X2 [Zerene cesonia]